MGGTEIVSYFSDNSLRIENLNNGLGWGVKG